MDLALYKRQRSLCRETQSNMVLWMNLNRNFFSKTSEESVFHQQMK